MRQRVGEGVCVGGAKMCFNDKNNYSTAKRNNSDLIYTGKCFPPKVFVSEISL